MEETKEAVSAVKSPGKKCALPPLDATDSEELQRFVKESLESTIPSEMPPVIAGLVMNIKVAMVSQLARNDRVPVEIVPGLYLGSIASIVFSKVLKDLGITHAVVALKGVKPQHVIRRIKRDQDWVKCLVLPLLDAEDENLVPHFETSSEFIKNALATGGKVLVHCFAGKSRSASLVLAYLMKERKMKLDEALKLVLSKRPIVSPNPGFLAQLRHLESQATN